MGKLKATTIGLVAVLLMVSVSTQLFARKPDKNRQLEIQVDEREDFYRYEKMRVSKETGAPLALYQENYLVDTALPEGMARQYLQENAARLFLKNDGSELKHTSTRETRGGYHVRFQQQINGYPVYGGNIVVNINRKNRVTFVMNGYKPLASLKDATPRISLAQADQMARNYLGIKGKINFEKQETVVYYNKGVTRLAHKIMIAPAEHLIGDWEVLVDAHSGEIFKVTDKRLYRDRRQDHRVAVTGSGWVFDPDPLTRAGASYETGGQFGDNGDSDSDSLTAQLVQVDLLDIALEDTTYFLRGPYAEIVDSDDPFDGIFEQDSSIFHYTRGQDNFEAVNVYYHIDKSMRYINETLSYSLVPFQYATGVKADPHGWGGSDNSSYSGFTGELSFGEGGVDDAEDEDVVLHELGHGLHDWLTDGHLSQVDGLSEGSGDYWTVSYNRSTGFWSSSDPQFNWVFQWDGHNEFWPGRVTDYGAHYPDGLVGQIHTDGQMWASTLMQIYDDIGKEACDLDFLEGLSMTDDNTSQEDAAQAFIQADIDLFGGVHLTTIDFYFTQRGYNVSIPAPDITHTPLGDTEDVNGPYTVFATISSAAPLDTVKLVYGTGASFTDTLDMTPDSEGYSADIPGSGTPTTYIYYIFASDTNGFASTDPSGAPGNFHSFTTGPDTFPPVIAHTPVTTASIYDLPLAVTAQVTDNQGVDSVWVEYKINGFVQASFALAPDSGDTYSGSFGFDSSDVEVGDTVAYKIRAQDVSSNQNQAASPDSGYHTFKIANKAILTRVVNIPIPDGTSTGIEDVLTVEGFSDVVITDVNVVFKAEHTWFGDFIVKLTAPDGAELTLIDRPGVPASSFGNSGNDPDILLDDDATESIEDVTFADDEQVAGVFHPDPDALSALNDKIPEGDWTIHVSDNADFDTGTLTEWGLILTLEAVTGIGDENYTLPREFALRQNYPNPFNPSTTIRYDLPRESKVVLKIFNMLGQEIKTLVNEDQTAGFKSVTWDGANNTGQRVSSGIYFFRIDARGAATSSGKQFMQTRKMILLK